MQEIIPQYNKNGQTGIIQGAFGVTELLQKSPAIAQQVFIHPAFSSPQQISQLCQKHNIPLICSEKAFRRINQKENIYAAAIFEKQEKALNGNRPHVCLVNPSDMGNLGTIIRTMAAFNFLDLAIIKPAADVFNPKCTRAAMGALFAINISFFTSFEEYRKSFAQHSVYPFMLNGINLGSAVLNENSNFCLVFGNEASGLPESFLQQGQALKIEQSPLVDSLNLSIAAGTAMYYFAQKYKLF